MEQVEGARRQGPGVEGRALPSAESLRSCCRQLAAGAPVLSAVTGSWVTAWPQSGGWQVDCRTHPCLLDARSAQVGFSF